MERRYRGPRRSARRLWGATGCTREINLVATVTLSIMSCVPRLFADLDLDHGDGTLRTAVPMLVKVDLLVLDDWGIDRLGQPVPI